MAEKVAQWAFFYSIILRYVRSNFLSLPPTQIARLLLLPSDRGPKRQGNLNLNTKDFSSFFRPAWQCERSDCLWMSKIVRVSDPWVSFKWRFNKFETFPIGKHINAINFRRGMADGDPNWWSFVIRISRRKRRRKKKHQNDGSFKYLWCARLRDVLVTFSWLWPGGWRGMK